MAAMKSLLPASLSLLLVTGTISAASPEPSHPPASDTALHMSPALLEIFRSEMRELLSGTQAISAAIPLGDWDSMVKTSHQMAQSHIMEKKLTAAQQKDLAALPEGFKDLDARFHARTEQLGQAAASRDPELVVFHYSRMLDACVGCHEAFAPARFPGLANQKPEAQPHH